jgi:hypothetical protein
MKRTIPRTVTKAIATITTATESVMTRPDQLKSYASMFVAPYGRLSLS